MNGSDKTDGGLLTTDESVNSLSTRANPSCQAPSVKVRYFMEDQRVEIELNASSPASTRVWQVQNSKKNNTICMYFLWEINVYVLCTFKIANFFIPDDEKTELHFCKSFECIRCHFGHTFSFATFVPILGSVFSHLIGGAILRLFFVVILLLFAHTKFCQGQVRLWRFSIGVSILLSPIWSRLRLLLRLLRFIFLRLNLSRRRWRGWNHLLLFLYDLRGPVSRLVPIWVAVRNVEKKWPRVFPQIPELKFLPRRGRRRWQDSRFGASTTITRTCVTAINARFPRIISLSCAHVLVHGLAGA